MPSWKKVITSGSDAALNSINVTSGVTITGSITVSGSVINNLTASYAISASQAVSASFSTTASYATQALSAAYAASAASATTASDATGIGSAITNNTDNNILTATGTGVINGEANLTFNSQILTLTNGILTFAGSTFGRIQQSLGGTANGLFSHAQGLAVGANGDYSHAEGSSTNALGFGSHAEGSGSFTGISKLYGVKFNTITSGVFQLAGDVTAVFAPGNRLYYNSAANPDNTTFVVDTSVFGGVNTTITLTNTGITDSNFIVGSLDYPYSGWNGNQQSVADGGHAEGFYTTAVADWSHAEGYQTQTFARYSHAEGYDTQANGTFSHAEGRAAKTFGQYSHAEGEQTQANGNGSHAEGESTTATGSYSHAEGSVTTSTGIASHAEGLFTTATGDFSHAEGYGTTATGGNSHAEGSSTTTGNANGYYTEMTASGVFTISSSYGDVSTAGLFNAGYIIGVDDSQYANTYTYANLIVASCSFNGTNTIVHVTDTTFFTSTANIGSISNFGNTGDRAWGGYAAHAQGNSTIAQGAYSHAEGNSTIAQGAYSHAEGASIAYGTYSHAEGASTAYGTYSHAEGSGAAYGTYSHAEGAGISGWIGYRISASIALGVIKLEPIYGDRTPDFAANEFVLIRDTDGDIVAGVPNTYRYQISSSAFTSSLTQITLYDTSVTSATTKPTIGIYGNPNPIASDVECGNFSHAAGVDTATLGEYSDAAGHNTRTLGWYQSVVGQFNQPISQPSAFIVGDGVDDATRHNLLVAASGSVVISGSLILTPTASGAPTSPGTDGQIIFGQAGGNYNIYVWLGGDWRSGSLS